MTPRDISKFDEIEAEFEPPADGATVSGTFQTVLNLCLSFLVIAALRTPFLSEEDLERAKLLERLRNTTEQLQEMDGRLRGYHQMFEIAHLSETEAWEWLGGVTDRIRKSELDAVGRIQLADIPPRAFPGVDDLAELARIDPAGSVVAYDSRRDEWRIDQDHSIPKDGQRWLDEQEETTVQAVTAVVAKEVLAKPKYLFKGTRDAIQARGQSLLHNQIKAVYATYVNRKAESRPLDWEDFREEGQDAAASRDAYPAALAEYARSVCGEVPNPYLVPDAGAAMKILTATLETQFEAKCGVLNEDDLQLAEAIRKAAAGQPLKPEHLYLTDRGRKQVEDYVHSTAGVNPGTPKGPRARSALDQVVESLFKSETDRVQNDVIKRVRAVQWASLSRRGCQVSYDDYKIEKEKTQEIADHLPKCVGLPEGARPDAAFARRIEAVALEHAAELFRQQIGAGHAEKREQVIAFIQRYAPVIEAGEEPIAKKAVTHPDVAGSEILEAIYRHLGITKPTQEHENAWKEETRQMITLAVDNRRVRERELLAKSKHQILDIKILDKLTIFDWEHKSSWVDQITEELVASAPSEFRNDSQLRMGQQKEAERLFEERMTLVEAAFQQKAERQIKILAEGQPPELWLKYTDQEIQEIVYKSLMKELVKESADSAAE